MRPVNNNITIFSDAEFAALYEIPEFDSNQRLKYLTLTDSEFCFVMTRKTLDLLHNLHFVKKSSII